ncbi:MAG: Ig-like domain-containing protein [Myxococcota bacterium]
MRTGTHALALLLVAASCGDDGGAAPPDAGTTTGEETVPSTGSSLDSTGSSDGPRGSTSDAEESSGTGEPEGPVYPEPDAHPPSTGPGGPAVEFAAEDLYVNCAFLHGGTGDLDHHNLVVMFDGYLMMPWAPEWGIGGLTFFDISDPCNALPLSSTPGPRMRETHATGFANVDDHWYAVVAAVDEGLLNIDGGIMIWDVTSVVAPQEAAVLNLPGHLYPDAYARVVLSAAWQAPYIYVGAADNGIYIVDATDPTQPQLAGQYNFQPTMRVGQVNVVGNMLIATAAEGPRTVLLDVSVPEFPQPIAGGDFEIVDGEGVIRESYFSNVGGGYVYYAIKNGNGGVMMYDIRDPANPVLAGHYDSGGNGGYVFAKDDLAFVGESSFAGIYDISDPAAMAEVATLDLEGDLDTVTPIGNVVVLSVDDEGTPGEGSAVAPYLTEVDTVAPYVNWSVPADGATGLPITTRVGVTFNEMVDVKSAWFGSVRLYRTGDDGEPVPVMGHISVQENVVNFVPRTPLDPGTEYTFEIPAGGVADYNGNRVTEPFSITLTTIGG